LRTRRFPSALAFFFSSLLLAGAAQAQNEARLRLLELESELARKPDLYLVLDVPARRLAVKVRGLELAAVELRDVALLSFRPLLGGGAEPPVIAPAVWTVREGPGDTDRETIAPTTLRPYSESEEQEETPAGGGAASPAADKPETPASYRVALDNGWQLFLVDEPPQLGWARRFLAAVRDGWQRLRGVEPAHPPLVALVIDSEEARRLHHLFRSGLPILVAPTS
jgi:hypothetical protein